MERLTMKFGDGQYESINPIDIYKNEYSKVNYHEIVRRLGEYEDLEEQGKLLKLPCAMGDTVYAIEVDEENFTHFYCPRKISEYKFNLQMMDLLGMFGKCIFLTREEAEAALIGN